ncbi:MAG: thiamine pyrophosphate-binding protein [Chthoniobacteraceae bacterium]|jgi:acetolactate synthase-1/2/3 large subunit
MKLSDYVIDRLISAGIKQVFMLPGGGAMHLNDSLGRRRSEIAFVPMLHEQAVSIAAEGAAKATNEIGVAMVTSGPAGTNAVTGCAGAWLDSMPCLFLSGQVKRPDLKGDSGLRQLGSQEVDIVQIVAPITKYAVTITEPTSIRYHLEKALYLAKAGRSGPVWLDFPLDVQAYPIEPAELEGFTPPAEPMFGDTSAETAEVIRMLQAAKRPVIVAGNGIHVADAVTEFREAVERIGAPILTTWLAMDLLPDESPYFGGRPGAIAPRGANFSLQNADLMIVIGSRLDMAFTAYAHEKLAREAIKVMVDVDAAEIAKMRTKIHLPIQQDARVFLRELLVQLKDVKLPDYGEWLGRVQEWKQKYPLLQPEHRDAAEKVSVYQFSDVLSGLLSEGDLVVSGSSGTAVELFLLAFRVKERQRVFHTRGLGAMGFAIPAAIGACIAAGRPHTVCIDGDGGFQMNIQELATVASLRLPIKFFVINNDGYASIRSSQQGYFKHLVAADSTSGLALPDLQKVAAGFDVPSVRIENQNNLAADLRAVLDREGPVVCEIMALPDEQRIPRVTAVQRPDGIMVSKPLEDLFPFLDREEFRSNMIVAPLEESLT